MNINSGQSSRFGIYKLIILAGKSHLIRFIRNIWQNIDFWCPEKDKDGVIVQIVWNIDFLSVYYDFPKQK